MMRNRTILLFLALLLASVFTLYAIDGINWHLRDRTPDQYRKITGLTSLAIGNLSPSARSPGYELLCTGLYDVPGGYCSYFTDGVPSVNYYSGVNVTLIGVIQ